MDFLLLLDLVLLSLALSSDFFFSPLLSAKFELFLLLGHSVHLSVLCLQKIFLSFVLGLYFSLLLLGFIFCNIDFSLDLYISFTILDEFDSIIKINAFVSLISYKFCLGFALEILSNDILDELFLCQFCYTTFKNSWLLLISCNLSMASSGLASLGNVTLFIHSTCSSSASSPNICLHAF